MTFEEYIGIWGPVSCKFFGKRISDEITPEQKLEDFLKIKEYTKFVNGDSKTDLPLELELRNTLERLNGPYGYVYFKLLEIKNAEQITQTTEDNVSPCTRVEAP